MDILGVGRKCPADVPHMTVWPHFPCHLDIMATWCARPFCAVRVSYYVYSGRITGSATDATEVLVRPRINYMHCVHPLRACAEVQPTPHSSRPSAKRKWLIELTKAFKVNCIKKFVKCDVHTAAHIASDCNSDMRENNILLWGNSKTKPQLEEKYSRVCQRMAMWNNPGAFIVEYLKQLHVLLHMDLLGTSVSKTVCPADVLFVYEMVHGYWAMIWMSYGWNVFTG